VDLEKRYFDGDGNKCNILQMIKMYPEWAANRLQIGEAAIETLAASRATESKVVSMPEWIDCPGCGCSITVKNIRCTACWEKSRATESNGVWIDKNDSMPQKNEKVIWGRWSFYDDKKYWAVKVASCWAKHTAERFTHWMRIPMKEAGE